MSRIFYELREEWREAYAQIPMVAKCAVAICAGAFFTLSVVTWLLEVWTCLLLK